MQSLNFEVIEIIQGAMIYAKLRLVDQPSDGAQDVVVSVDWLPGLQETGVGDLVAVQFSWGAK